jgi:hypothetical protein
MKSERKRSTIEKVKNTTNTTLALIDLQMKKNLSFSGFV